MSNNSTDARLSKIVAELEGTVEEQSITKKKSTKKAKIEMPDQDSIGRKCPVPHAVVDGRLIVEGEDWGDAIELYAEGKKIRDYIHICNRVAECVA